MIENPGQTARKNAVRDLILGVVFFILLSVVLSSDFAGVPLSAQAASCNANSAANPSAASFLILILIRFLLTFSSLVTFSGFIIFRTVFLYSHRYNFLFPAPA